MNWLFEESIYVVLIGVPLTLGAAFGWLKNGSTPLLVVAAVFLLMTIGGVILEGYVVTDREHVTTTLEQIAVDVQAGHKPTILAHIHPNSDSISQRFETHLNRYPVTSARITKIHEIIVDRESQPPRCVVKLNATAHVNELGGPIAFTVTLRLDGDRWKVFDYKYETQPFAHFQNNPR
jgi:hypothetical protein